MPFGAASFPQMLPLRIRKPKPDFKLIISICYRLRFTVELLHFFCNHYYCFVAFVFATYSIAKLKSLTISKQSLVDLANR